MNDSGDDQPKKIIIDEDWKTQVEREKGQLDRADESPADDAIAADGAAAEGASGIPPASFELLISTLATQAMVYLGQIPDPIENKQIVELNVARHHIDMLAMLEEKTRGNLSDEEQQALETIIHQLRMAYMAISEQATK